MRRWASRCVDGFLLLAALGLVGLTVCWHLFPFPMERLDALRSSRVVTDRDGRPLLALASDAGEWRLPASLDGMSPWLTKATIAVEDKRFYSHTGVDPIAATRAAAQNTAGGRVVSGASTLTMQLCRMLDPRPRRMTAKLLESFRALQLERLLEKDEILACYLDHAPYGGNIRGAETASRIWFGKSADDLSLAEAALLAGLPQSPTRHRPDRHPESAKKRRDQVLACMFDQGMIDAARMAEAAATPIQVRPLDGAAARLAAGTARHAAWWALSQRPKGGRTTIDSTLQAEVERQAGSHAATLPAGSDIAVVVIDVETAEVLALVGSADPDDPIDGQVNGALAYRSPGSALKPFLFAAAFSTGRLGPLSTVPDRGVDLGGWTPENFAPGFSGDVTAAEALRRSLNIPALLVTRAAGLARSVGCLTAAGVRMREDAAERGGLALATGAIEVRLLDLTNAYATLARGGVHRPARIFPDEPAPERRALTPAVAATLDEILSSRARPPAGLESIRPEDVSWFMWKTGTSSGRRDAWAVGHNRRFGIGVWAGRFSGAGHYEYVGARSAEPLLAGLFEHPLIRSDEDPAPAPALPVDRPFFLGREESPRILAPSDGSVFHSTGGPVVLRPRANVSGTWFVNGRHVPDARRLSLDAGRHELRLVTDAGRSSRVQIVVR